MRKNTVWRLHTKTDNLTQKRVSDYCLDHSVLAIGWSLKDKDLGEKSQDSIITDARKAISNMQEEESFQAYLSFVEKHQIYEKVDNVKRLKQVQPYDLVWMRQDGVYWLGIVGDDSKWLYDSSDEMLDMDASNQRTNIKWFKVGGESDVAGMITTAFIGGNTLQRIHLRGALEFSQTVINSLYQPIYQVETAGNISDIFFNLIHPSDCEDLVCMWLYKEFGYVTLPSTCKSSTQLYECVLIDPKCQSNKEVYIQVKKGNVDLCTDDYAHLNGEVWLLTTEGRVSGNKYNHIHVLKPHVLLEFIMDENNNNVLPEKVLKWRNLFRS